MRYDDAILKHDVENSRYSIVHRSSINLSLHVTCTADDIKT
jgi:hypothetical protein